MKGFKKDGKFRPTENRKKSSLTKDDIKHQHSDDRIGKTLPLTRKKVDTDNPQNCKYGNCIKKGKDINEFCSDCLKYANKTMTQDDLDSRNKKSLDRTPTHKVTEKIFNNLDIGGIKSDESLDYSDDDENEIIYTDKNDHAYIISVRDYID
jgi:hypothetical protein